MTTRRDKKRDKHESRPLKGTTRRHFLVSTASLSAGLFLAGKAVGQEAAAPADAAAAAPAAEGAAAAPAAAAPVAITPPAAAPSITRKGANEMLQIALIGAGAQGSVLMEATLRVPTVRFKAVVDIWEYSRQRVSRTLKKYGHDVTAYTDYREMLDAEKGKVDVAIVATPDFYHHEHAIACMEAGLDVYCEKEMSNTIENARRMVEASRATGRLLQIGHQRRSNPRYRHAIDRVLLENKMLGRVTHGYGQWNRAKSDDIGWPKKYEISTDDLEKYGYDSMQHFRNWRWYKKYGGGPIVDLGSHQIDIFSWVFGAPPTAVMAAGGVDFYPHHEWYDNVLCIFDYATPQGTSRAFYQVLTTTSNGGFYETFMGTDGTLVISEVAQRGDHVLREANAPDWEPFAQMGLVKSQAEAAPAAGPKGKDIAVDVRVSAALGSWPLPIELNKPAHQPHLENFFDAVRLGVPLNCPAELGYETAVAVHKVNEAVEAGRKLMFDPQEFKA